MPTRTTRRPVVSKLKVWSDPHLAIDVPAYRQEAQAELNRLLDLMEETWGFRPALTLKTETCLVASADFNLQDFAHQGAKAYVRPETAAGRNKPKEIARRIVAELVVHRNTCVECGTGLPPLYQRINALEAFLHPRWEGQAASTYFIPPDAPIKYDTYRGERHAYRESRPVTLADIKKWFLNPADAVERACFPRQAVRLDKLIAEWHAAHAPQPEPLEYVI